MDGGAAKNLSIYSSSTNQEEFDFNDLPTAPQAWNNLHSVKYRGYNLLGWCFLFKKYNLIKLALEKYKFKLGDQIDSDGNTILHYASMYGNKDILSYIVAYLEKNGKLDFEVLNFSGYTPAMEGARAKDHSDFHATMTLIKLGANARMALKGKFYGWILALAIKRNNHSVSNVNSKDSSYYNFKYIEESSKEDFYRLFNKK